MDALAYHRLGDLLISIGVITEEQLAQALAIQQKTHKRLGSVLIEYNFIKEQQLIEALEMQLGVEFIDLSSYQIPTELAGAFQKHCPPFFCCSGQAA